MIKLNGEPLGWDIKSDGAQVIRPPSINVETGGKYKWEISFKDCQDKNGKVIFQEIPECLKKILSYDNIDDNFNPIKDKKEIEEIKEIAEDEVDADFEYNKNYKSIFRRNCRNTKSAYLFDLFDILPNSAWNNRDWWLESGYICKNFFYNDQEAALKVWNYFSAKSDKYEGIESLEERNIFAKTNNLNMIGISSLERKIINECGQDVLNKIKLKYKRSTNENSEEVFAKFDREDPYVWEDFRKEFNGKTFSSILDMKLAMKEKIVKVFVRISGSKIKYIRKINLDDKFYDESGPMTIKYEFMCYYNSIKKIKDKKTGVETTDNIEIEVWFDNDFITINSTTLIPCYSEIIIDPTYKNTKGFNIWKGYKAKLSNKNIDLSMFFNFVKKILCKNDEVKYEYLLTFIFYIIKYPEQKIPVCLFLYSNVEGVGKNTFTDIFINYIIGINLGIQLSGLKLLTTNFNKHLLGKKLIIVNEASSAKDTFISNFDDLKDKISEKLMMIEPKGLDPYQVNNISSIIINSNHKNSLHLSATDRRFFCLDVSEEYVGNYEYFENFRKICYNQDFADALYTYFINYDEKKLVNVYNVPITNLKKEIIEVSISNSIRFINQLIESILDERFIKWCESNKTELPEKMRKSILYQQFCESYKSKKENIDKEKIKASDLYNQYKCWCNNNGESAKKNISFALDISVKIPKKIKSDATYYFIIN